MGKNVYVSVKSHSKRGKLLKKEDFSDFGRIKRS